MPPETTLLRPAAAASRFGVCTRTLARWAKDGRIGWSKVGRIKFYVASDIADIQQHGLTRRTVVPMVAATQADSDWRSDPLWAGTPAATGGRQ